MTEAEVCEMLHRIDGTGRVLRGILLAGLVFLIVICAALVLLSLLLTVAVPAAGIAGIVFGILGIVYSVRHIKNNKQ